METSHSLKAEGGGFVLKLTEPKRTHRGYKLLIFAAYHVNAGEQGKDFVSDVYQVLTQLRNEGLLTELAVIKKTGDVKLSDTHFICTHIGANL